MRGGGRFSNRPYGTSRRPGPGFRLSPERRGGANLPTVAFQFRAYGLPPAPHLWIPAFAGMRAGARGRGG